MNKEQDNPLKTLEYELFTAGDLQCARLKRAPNTFFWSKNRTDPVPGLHPWNIPEAILKRLRLNLLGLNRLSTHIFPSNTRPTMADLKHVLRFSNQVNQSLYLPDSEDLIIRTRKTRPPGEDEAVQKFTAPALLVMGVGEKARLKLLGEESAQRPQDLEDFFQKHKDTFLIIHDDNEETQKAALHGNFIVRDSTHLCSELMLGEGMVHARQLNRELSGDCREEVGKPFLHLKGKSESVLHHPSYVRGPAKSLFWWARMLQDDILETYEQVVNEFGKGVNMEFRLYRNTGYANFHVLDVMRKIQLTSKRPTRPTRPGLEFYPVR